MGRIRRPAVAGAFYPGTAGELEAAVRGYLRDAQPDVGADEKSPVIFADGFESGDTTAWTTAVS